MSRRYFEDFAAGDVLDLGTYAFTADEMIAFARAYDPQPMHVDPDAARDSPYGGLIASGWHTVSAYMRLLVHGMLLETASLGSPGVDTLRWLKPVRPGDVLHGRFTILELTPSRSRPTWGIVRSRGEMISQDDETVMQMEAVNFVARRPAA